MEPANKQPKSKKSKHKKIKKSKSPIESSSDASSVLIRPDSSPSSSTQSPPSSSHPELFEPPAKLTTRYEAVDGTTVLRMGTKPKFSASEIQSSPLLTRLRQFIPELAAANQTLQEHVKAGNPAGGFEVADDDDENVQDYIQLDLGLGVLEEQNPSDMTNDESRNHPHNNALVDWIDDVTGAKDPVQVALHKPKRKRIQEMDS